MAQRRTSMKRVREALRLLEECRLSQRQISKALNVSRPVINSYIDKCKELEISYEKSCTMTDEELLNSMAETKKQDPRLEKLTSYFPKHEKELTRVGVTRHILWEEYAADNPDSYSYSQYCYHFQHWVKSKEIYMRINHKAGDKLYVDYTGKKLEVTNPQTGEITRVEVFIGTLGASKLIYIQASPSQKKHDFITAQVNALKYIGGVPTALVPDCLKSAVTKGSKYEPELNQDYYDFASHYGTTILPARPYKPKDKALVEGAVTIVYSAIFAPLRDKVFFSIESLNAAIRVQLDILNNKIMKSYKASRWELFHEIEKDALKPLPVDDYEVRYFIQLKVNFDYHVFIKDVNHNFSVPYKYCGMRVDVFYTASTVEIYHNNRRIALHDRKRIQGFHTTKKEHMHPNHQFVDGWSPEKFQIWAQSYGDSVKEVIDSILISKEHPEQGYKVSMGILSLAKKFSKERLDKACSKALHYNMLSYKFIKNILENRQEDYSNEPNQTYDSTPEHENIRGAEYYAKEEEL